MTNTTNDRQIKLALTVTFLLYLVARILGAFLLKENWSFSHIFHIPVWYYIIPVTVCASLWYTIRNENRLLENILNNRLQTILLSAFFLLLFIVFQSDSFLYGGGNYKINQIAQVDRIMYQFYEFGTVLLVSLFYKLLALFNMDNNSAGVVAWKLFSYLGVALTFVASVLLSKIISEDNKNRFLIFLVIFFGPQTISYFGFVGNTTFITASIYFFIYYGLAFEKEKSIKTLALLWAITLISISMHISLLLLVPPLLFVTYKKFIPKKNIAFILGINSYLLLLVAVYWVTSSDFAFMKQILFLESHNMHARYALFSLKHITDFLQLLLLVIPQILIVKYLFFIDVKNNLKSYKYQLITIVVLSATTLAFILEPTHSIILDSPLLAVYLSPIAIFLALLIANSRSNLRHAVLFSLFVPLLTLPSYTHIDIAEKQIETYLEHNHHQFVELATSLQDSYFYQGEIDKANYWYTNLPKFSRDFLDLTAAGEYGYAKMYPEAMKLLYQLKTKAPFWGEPHFQIASLLIQQRSFKIARAEIDTCLILSPYANEYLKIDYVYYRELGDFNKMKEKVLYALTIFPNDYNIKTDLVVAYYRLRDLKNADAIAIEVIQNDPTQAFAYLIRGFIAEIQKQPANAIEFFTRYIQLAPDEPETPNIRKRVNNLILEQRDNN